MMCRGITRLFNKNMITYELAKELKDAGFPQYGDDRARYFISISALGFHAVFCNRYDKSWQYEGSVKIPNLEELIEACGKQFNFLHNGAKMGWTATAIANKNKPKGEGSTPEEAVCRLWLALQKDKEYTVDN